MHSYLFVPPAQLPNGCSIHFKALRQILHHGRRLGHREQNSSAPGYPLLGTAVMYEPFEVGGIAWGQMNHARGSSPHPPSLPGEDYVAKLNEQSTSTSQPSLSRGRVTGGGIAHGVQEGQENSARRAGAWTSYERYGAAIARDCFGCAVAAITAGFTAVKRAEAKRAERRVVEPTSGTGKAPRAERIIETGSVPIVRVANPA